jgi:hypothetical protein
MWILGLAVGLAGEPVNLDATLAAVAPLRGRRQISGLPAIPATAWTTAAAGEIAWGVVEVEGEAARKTWGVAVIAQPIERVWGAINDEALLVRYTDLSYAEVVRGRPCEAGRHVLQVLPVGFPGVSDRWWVTVRSPTATLAAASGGRVRELSWVNAPDGSAVTSASGKAQLVDRVMVGFTRGAWLLAAVDPGHTLVEYYAWVHPGGSLPAGLMATFAGKTLRNTFDAVGRAAADSTVSCLGG